MSYWALMPQRLTSSTVFFTLSVFLLLNRSSTQSITATLNVCQSLHDLTSLNVIFIHLFREFKELQHAFKLIRRTS